ncbi:MAG: RsmE family RNA methyltransferase [Bacilli bacterium]
MQRYVVDENLKLDKKDINHIINVMRLNVNDQIKLINNGTIYDAIITKIEKNNVLYEIIKKEESKSLKDYKVIIACSIIKEQKMDYLLQKATELGVDEIIPIISERTIVKVKQASSKIDRWNRIIKESVEQSHRVSIPIIKDIISLKELSNLEYSIKILCNTNEKSKNIKKVLQDSKKRDTIIIVVGPEGGFTDSEINYLENSGFISTSLGKNILRAETVPLYVLSVINYEFMGD